MSNNPALPALLAAIRARRAVLPEFEARSCYTSNDTVDRLAASKRYYRWRKISELAEAQKAAQSDVDVLNSIGGDIDALLAAIDALLAERVTSPAATTAGAAEPGESEAET